MQVGRKVVFVAAANILGATLGYGALLVIGRSFAPAAYGSFVFASGLTGLFALATTLGLGTAHQRLVARGVPPDIVLGTAVRMRLALLLAGLALVAFVATTLRVLDRPLLTDATTPTVLAGVLVIQVLAMARMFLTETWGGHQQVSRVEGVRVLDAAVFLALLANAGLMVSHLAGRWTPLQGLGAWWATQFGFTQPLTAAQAALVLVACAALAKFISLLFAGAIAVRDGTRFGPFDRTIARELWAFGLPVALTGAVALVVQYTDVILLGYFWSAAEVGLYGTAQKLAVVAGLASVASAGVLLSRFAQLASTGQAEKEAETFHNAQRWLLGVVALLVAGLVGLATPILHIAVGDAYLPAARSLQWLALATLAYTIQIPVTTRFMGHGQTRVLVQGGALNALVNVALNSLFIPKAFLGWGPAGAAAATLASNLAAYGYLRYRASQAFQTPWRPVEALRIAWSAAAVATGWLVLQQGWPQMVDRVWELAAWGLVGSLAYLALLVLLGGLGGKDLVFLRRSIHPKALWNELRGR